MIDSIVFISGKATPSLMTAGEVISLSESCVFSNNKLECDVAAYMAEVFQADVNLESGVTAGEYLHSKMANTPYRSVRGEQRNIALFHADFVESYKDLSDNWFTELWQIQKVLTGDRINFYEICLMAFFLNITADELVHMELPEKTQEQFFDEEVYRLHEQGLKYPAIAKALNAPYMTVKAIGEPLYKDNAETIIGNMDSVIFLGGREKITLKDLVEVLGKESIDTYTTSDTRGTQRSYGTNFQKLGRELLHLMVKSSVAQNKTNRDTIQLDILQRLAK